MFDVTDGPWILDLSAAIAALITVAGGWKFLVSPLLRGIWAAVVAAPKIATGMARLIELIETDVIGRLDAGAIQFQEHKERLDALDGCVAAHAVRLDALEGRRLNGRAE